MLDSGSAPQPPDDALDGAALFDRGRQAEQAGDLARAHALYLQLVARGDDAEGRYRLGCVCLKRGDFAAAAEEFEAGLSLRPGDARMLTNLGVALDRLGRREEAVTAYHRAVLRDDAPAAAHHNLGAYYAEMGRTEDAVRAFGEAVRRTPDAEGYCSLGLVLLAARDLVGALEAFEQAVACDRAHVRGHYYAAVCLLKRGRYQESLQRFEWTLGLEPSLTRAHFHRGVCLHKLERYEPALAALALAETAFPEDGRIHFQLALTCDALGMAAEARRHYHLARLHHDETRHHDPAL
jgi:tetratricopeptide (TPR) repeat protein